jgi:bacillithiol biosynthesis cysteine-adding enzyme BshC
MIVESKLKNIKHPFINKLLIDIKQDRDLLEKVKLSDNCFEIDYLISERIEKNYPRKEVVESINNLLRKTKISKEQEINLDLLTSNKTFTVTTGHQLQIFGGPLFFIYKIASAIAYCQKLKKENPDYNFVPLYWMATEDHDFEEISSVNLFGNTFKWELESLGKAVGNLIIDDKLVDITTQIVSKFGNMPYAKDLQNTFSEAYKKGRTLAEATTYWVSDLFGKYGLLVIDANDAILKQTCQPIFQNDINGNLYPLIKKQTETLEDLGYKTQIAPRKCNLFYLDVDGSRLRIDTEDWKNFETQNQQYHWNYDELHFEIQNNPEKFSPNVALRPLYEEVLLPNLAYIGGPSELIYWYQLIEEFAHLNIPYPIPTFRDSWLIIGNKTQKNLQQAQVLVEDLLLNEKELIDKFYLLNDAKPELLLQLQKLNYEFSTYENLVRNYSNKQLASTLVKNLKDIAKEFKNQKKEIESELAKQNETVIEKLKKSRETVFPNQSFQERHDNFIPYFLKTGNEWIQFLIENSNVGELELKIWEE